MNDFDQLLNFLNSTDHFFIGVEGRPDTIQRFVRQHNDRYNRHIDGQSDGIFNLKDNANKRGVECRLYVTEEPPDVYNFKRNTTFRKDEYSFRLNDNDVIERLFGEGFNVGMNWGAQ